ncbi:hypothetical protein Lser_V15G04358 [Lactuca serriola]
MASEACEMEKPIVIDHHQEQQQQCQKQQSLKCPRCDSSNTKFCYYNNYSLSQPRHFCKACKRYWTRGGTLRNVPVGGGCRKNKRVFKMLPTATTHAPSNSQPLDNNPNPNCKPNFDNHPSFYGLVPQNQNFERFNRVVSGCDFSQPQRSNLGLGFSSMNQSHNSSLFLSSYPSSVFAESTSCSNSVPTMASLLISGFQQPQRYMEWNNHFECQNNDDQLEAMASSDPNSLIWNTTSGGGGGSGGGGWFDPTSNIDSSVASFI